MPRLWWTLGKEIDRYLLELEEAERSKTTIHDYGWALRNMFEGLRDAGHPINPRKVGKKEIDFLKREYFEGRADSYRVHMLSILKLFLKWAGNKEVDHIRFPTRTDVRNVRWLEDHQAMTLKMAGEGIERIIVHCELDLGMRRIEVLRLKASSFQTGRTNTVLIHGKGRNGGKWRDIEWHPDTPQELEAYLAIRDAEIAKAKSKNPDVVVPENLLIYEADGKLKPYKKSAIDKFLKALGLRTGIEFSNHDLRRTCGRMMYRAGVDIVRIARIFGHSDTKTTMRYLGLDHEEMASAMNQYAQYQKAVVFPKVETIEVSQQKSGPCGI